MELSFRADLPVGQVKTEMTKNALIDSVGLTVLVIGSGARNLLSLRPQEKQIPRFARNDKSLKRFLN